MSAVTYTEECGVTYCTETRCSEEYQNVDISIHCGLELDDSFSMQDFVDAMARSHGVINTLLEIPYEVYADITIEDWNGRLLVTSASELDYFLYGVEDHEDLEYPHDDCEYDPDYYIEEE